MLLLWSKIAKIIIHFSKSRRFFVDLLISGLSFGKHPEASVHPLGDLFDVGGDAEGGSMRRGSYRLEVVRSHLALLLYKDKYDLYLTIIYSAASY